ncbi:Aldehyde dehydrogenase, cytosolic 1 [Verticillium dahliae VDG1]|nr:Aldehyde dehydrogenase, cytosolic 1 [Verticillium dahliae VDG1]
MKHTSKPIQLDGRTGEGGGQILRVAVALAAVTSQPVTVSEIRGNRLKSQHATSIQYLAAATAATTTSLAVGARCLTFSPTLPPAALAQRHITITPESPGASALLILQALLPFLIFAAGDPITLDIAAGTNVSSRLPASEVVFRTVEDSGYDARVYVLLVARSAGGLRWGRDVLTSAPKVGKSKGRSRAKEGGFPTALSRKLAVELVREVERPGGCDESLQDQLVVFQALAEGQTVIRRDDAPAEGESPMVQAAQAIEGLELGDRRRSDKATEPFGQGSLHSQTARWVASEMLPAVKWYNKGTICEGAGVSSKISSA